MNYIQIINSILVLTVIIFIGFIISKLNIINEAGASVISGVIMKVTFPAIILTSMQKSFSQELFRNSIGLIALSVVIYAVLIVFVTILGKASFLPIDKLKVMQFLIVFGTVSFIGFPVVIMATQAPLTAGVFAKTYGGDELLANKSIVLSNLLAIITVPLIILLIGV